MSKNVSLTVDVVTLFPSMFEKGPLSESLMGRARKNGHIKIRIHDLRKWSPDKRHQKVDDRPFGGGAGMLIMAEPLYQAIKALGGMKKTKSRPWVVYLSPQGKALSQGLAQKIGKKKHLILICGHYEGIDERVMEWIDQEISIGDYVLTGGEIPAMVLIDVIARLKPGVVGDPESVENESFTKKFLDYPHYTRPSVWRKRKVPEVLMSGHHKKINQWRKKAAQIATKRKRPDLL